MQYLYEIPISNNKYGIEDNGKGELKLTIFETLPNQDTEILFLNISKESLYIFDESETWIDFTNQNSEQLKNRKFGSEIKLVASKMNHRKCSIHFNSSQGRQAWGFWCEKYSMNITKSNKGN